MLLINLLLIKGVSDVQYVSMSNTDTTPQHVTIFNYVIFSNFYQCGCVCIVYGVCVWLLNYHILNSVTSINRHDKELMIKSSANNIFI